MSPGIYASKNAFGAAKSAGTNRDRQRSRSGHRASEVNTEAQIQELARYIDEQAAVVAQAHASILTAQRKMGELIELQEKQTGLKF